MTTPSFFPFTYWLIMFPDRWLRLLIPAGSRWRYLQTFLWKNVFTVMFIVGSCTFFHQALEQTVLFKDSISEILADISYIDISNPKHLAGRVETLVMGPITKDHVWSHDVSELWEIFSTIGFKPRIKLTGTNYGCIIPKWVSRRIAC